MSDGFGCWREESTSGITFHGFMPATRVSTVSLYITAFRVVAARCDPNVVGGFGRCSLHEVAAAGEHVTDDEAATLADILLQAGARTDVRDDLLKSTPLGWACRWG